jgi:cysteine desulfurase
MPIYLDNNATTGLDPRVLEVMLPELSSQPSNPSSVHALGQKAKQRLNDARGRIATLLKVKPQEILFTSGGTESMNMLIHALINDTSAGHVITSNVEHSCVYHTLCSLSKSSLQISFLPAGLLGAVSAEEIEKAIRSDTKLIILSAVNSETGVKHDIEKIADIAERTKIPFIVDGVALLGKELFRIPNGVSGMGFSAHKFHGPKGIGFVFLKSSLKSTPLLQGGDQEFKKRAGTENLPGIIGLAKAVELLQTELPEATHRMAYLRDRLENGLLARANPAIVNGVGPRIANTCNLSFPELHGEDLLIALDLAGIAVSHGSACSSGALEPSRILTQMGIPTHIARSALRFSLSRWTTEEEIDACVETLSAIISRLRKK